VIPPGTFTKIATTTTPEITEETKHSLMTLVHNHYTAGHPGRDETIHKAKQHASWNGMNSWIADYIKGCTTCQQNKILTHKKKIPLYRISTKKCLKGSPGLKSNLRMQSGVLGILFLLGLVLLLCCPGGSVGDRPLGALGRVSGQLVPRCCHFRGTLSI